MRIVITGSFAGQDSVGDECLLKAVIARLRHLRPQATIEFQLNDPSNSFAVQEAGVAGGFEPRRGLQYSMQRMTHVLGRLRLPSSVASYFGDRSTALSAKLGLFGAADSIDRLKRADAFFVFGGTQFSGQWYRLNAPAYLQSARIVRAAGGRVYFGPQQYGPLAARDAGELRQALRDIVTDWRTRNPLDAELLELDAGRRADREVYDEVFAATKLYPSRERLPSRHLLFNLRHTTFDNQNSFGPEVYSQFTRLVDALIERYDLPAVFFGVSGATFCDDDAAYRAVKTMSRQAERISSIGRVRDEHQLIELAQAARAVVSMSFHGCILSGIADAPFIPVSEGNYYDCKYAAFDKYTGGQGSPLLSLSSCDPKRDLERIAAFVDRYQPDAVRSARVRASDLADEFYRSALMCESA